MTEYGIFNDRTSSFWDNPKINDREFDWLFSSPLYIATSIDKLQYAIDKVTGLRYPKDPALIIKRRDNGEWYV